MKLINKTRYNSEALRRLFSACMNRVKEDWGGWPGDWPKVKGLRVTVVYARRKNFISGYAYYNKPVMKVRIPANWELSEAYALHQDQFHIGFRNRDIVQVLAGTFIHELGHNLGVHGHVRKPGSTFAACTIEHNYEAFIYSLKYDDYPIAMPAAAAAKPDVRLHRYDAALANLKTADTRLKRAKTLFQKWQQKVRYYERTLPAAALRPRKEKS